MLRRGRGPTELHVAVPREAGRSPVLERVGERVRIGKWAPVLARPELADLAPGMTQPERRLSGVHTGAEQFELENGLEVAQRCRCRRLDTQPALSDAGKRTVILAELALERGQLRQAQGVEPVWVDRIEVVPHVQHGKAIDLHLRRLLGSSGRRHETDQKYAYDELL